MKIKTPPSNVIEPDMTPMIDIVFQLIAFFMIVTNFEQTQADERVKLPANELARPPLAPREQELVLNMGFIRTPDGTPTHAEPLIFRGAGNNFLVKDFSSQLELEARVAQAKKIDPKSMTVTIRADAEVPTGDVQQLIKTAQEAGFEKFALKAKSEEQKE
jgi:biopolymer transport protein ExbD